MAIECIFQKEMTCNKCMPKYLYATTQFIFTKELLKLQELSVSFHSFCMKWWISFSENPSFWFRRWFKIEVTIDKLIHIFTFKVYLKNVLMQYLLADLGKAFAFNFKVHNYVSFANINNLYIRHFDMHAVFDIICVE